MMPTIVTVATIAPRTAYGVCGLFAFECGSRRVS